MPGKSRLREFLRAARIATTYLFSHHEESELYKCYHIGSSFFCSRCMGIYPGILAGFLAYFYFKPDYLIMLSAIVVFPMFAVLDWLASSLKLCKSHNSIRTLSGLLLGIAYSWSILLFFKTFPNFVLVLIGIIYAVLALFLILFFRRKH